MNAHNLSSVLKYGDTRLNLIAELAPTIAEEREGIACLLHSVFELRPTMQGLAAPQIGINARVILCVVNQKPMILFNPVIVKKSRKSKLSNETCLSVDGAYNVVRPLYIEVRFSDTYNKEHFIKAQWPLCRVFCHEIDHLNGICLPERARMQRDL